MIACFRSNVWGCYCSYSKNFWSVLKQKLPAFRQMSKDRDCDAQLISEKKQKRPFLRVFHPDGNNFFLVRFFQVNPEENFYEKDR